MAAVPHIVLSMLAACVAGAVWGGLAGLLKATTGANEVISTIMLNWIAVWTGIYLFGLGGPLQSDTETSVPVSNDIAENAKLPVFWGDPELQGLHVGIFVALAALLVFWVLLNRTRTGFEVRAVGFNPEAARAAGISVGRNYVLVMAICGLFAGLAGSLDVLGWQFRVATNDIEVSQIGFLGIAVALLGRNTAVGVLFSALLFGALVTGTSVRNLDPTVFEPAKAVNLTLDHPGPRRPDGERRRARDVPVAAAQPPAAARWRRPDGGGAGMSTVALRRRPPTEDAEATRGLTARHVGWAGVVLGFLAFFVALPPLTIRSPVPTVILALAAAAAGVWALRGGERRLATGALAAAVVGLAGGIAATQSGRRQPRARGRVVGAVRRHAPLRDAAALRCARRAVLGAQRGHQHRPRGHDADGRVLGHLGCRGERLMGGRTPHRHGLGRAAGAHPCPLLGQPARRSDRVGVLDELPRRSASPASRT